MGALTSVADIWLGITPVETYHGIGAEGCNDGKRLLAQYQHLLEIFGWVPCQFGILGLVSTSVEDIDAPD